MSAYAGPAPWYQGVSETYKNGRYKKRLVSGNQEWNLEEGWHAKRKAGWYNRPSKRKGQTVEKVKLIGLNGEEIETYVSKGYKDSIGFSAQSNEDAAAYASNALDSDKPDHGPIFDVQVKEGHIKRMEYASREQVMRVTFWNDSQVIYFRVPTTVAGMFKSFAENNFVHHPDEKTGKPRHILGVAFWNLVRIRGQQHGSRYPFQYEKHGVYKLTGSNKLYRIKLTADNIEKLFGRKYNGALKPGDVIETPLSEEQYELYDEARALDDNTRSINGTKISAVEYDKAGVGRQIDAVQSAEDDFFDQLNKELRNNRQAAQTELTKRDPLTADEHNELRSLIADLNTGRNKARSNLYDKRREPADLFEQWKSEHAAEYNDLVQQEQEHALRKGEAGRIAMRKAALSIYQGEEQDVDTLAARIKRATNITDESKMRGYVGIGEQSESGKRGKTGEREKLYGRASEILGDKYGRYVELTRKAAAPYFANNLLRRVWTKDDLYKMADPAVMPDNNQRAIYKAHLATGDWQSALDFLKTHQGPASRWYKRTGQIITYNKKQEPYAKNSDILDV